jgi:hypothetical protein
MEKRERTEECVGDGTHHVPYFVHDDIPHKVTFSEGSESVYVTYYEGEKFISVRFSNHGNNAIKFGDELPGPIASKDEILYHLGLKKRTFVPRKHLYIWSRMVKKTDVRNYEESELTIQEMYSLGAGADISAHTGKVAKGSSRLILGGIVEEVIEKGLDVFGQVADMGDFIYHD